jgi:DNA-binding MarR family transcriptional regulator
VLFGRSTPPEALQQHTGFLLNWCAARCQSSFSDAMGELGLRPAQFGLLNVIAGQPGLMQQALVDESGIDPSTMVALLDGLEASGWAQRRPHPTDRRKRAVHLTPAGEALLVQAGRAAKGVSGEMLAPLRPAERQQLHELLRRLAGLDNGV